LPSAAFVLSVVVDLASRENVMTDQSQSSLTELTVDLLAAFVSNNSVGARDLPELIASTHAALAALEPGKAGEAEPEPEAVAEPEFPPAVSIRKSLGKREQILSMIDGKPYKTLKRHLSRHGLTPAEYRVRYNLPADYPMVAPAYSEQRSAAAKRIGLGRKPGMKRKSRPKAG
jgi:predicted transcriptional regulator